MTPMAVIAGVPAVLITVGGIVALASIALGRRAPEAPTEAAEDVPVRRPLVDNTRRDGDGYEAS